jgi:hypothetical protein
MKRTLRNLWSYVWATSLVVVVLAGLLVVAACISGVPVERVLVEEWVTKVAAFLPLAVLYGVMEAEDGRIWALLTRTGVPGVGGGPRVDEKETARLKGDVEACWEKAAR